MFIDESFRHHLISLSMEAFDLSADVTYIVDQELRLRGYNEAWRQFALKNGGAEVLEQYTFGRSILDAMSPEPRAFYENAYRRALQNRGRFDQRFECPSATVYRNLQQSAFPLVDACGLVVTNHLVEDRPMDDAGNLPSVQYLSDQGLVVQCCHCRRVEDQVVSNKWDWVPQWVDRSPPATSHTFCPACHDFYYRSLAPPTYR
jgi:hypothetical protein